MTGLRLLAGNARFRWLVACSALWYATRAYELVTLSWFVLERTNSVAAVAAVGAARMFPMLLAFAGGTLSDRMPRLRLLRITQGCSLTMVTAFMVLLALSPDGPPAWSAHVQIGLMGTLWSIDFANRRSSYAEMMAPGELAVAVPVDMATLTAGLIIGPIIAGFLTRTGGFLAAYAGLAAIHAASLLLLPRRESVRSQIAPNVTAPARGLHSALATLRGNRVLQAVIAVTLVANMFAFPFHQLVPVIARDVLSADALRFGLLAATWGVGAVIGALVLSSRAVRRPGWVHALGLALLLVSIGGFAVSERYALSIGILLAGGMSSSGFASMQILLGLRSVAPGSRGRALGVIGLAIGAQTFGVLLLGFLAERTGPQVALSAFAVLGLGSLGLVRLWYPEIGRRGATVAQQLAN